MSLEHIIETNRLFDQYKSLLTNRQKQMLTLYYEEDLSLGEIAEQTGITRQAVLDNVRRGEKLLQEYEEDLKLSQKMEKRITLYNKLKDTTGLTDEQKDLIDQLIDLEYTN